VLHAYTCTLIQYTMCLAAAGLQTDENFCLGTGVPRHSAGGVGTFVRTYVVRIVCNAHARVMEAENSITLTSEHVFITLRWRSKMIMGFHEYTYQDREYLIRAMNTKHAQCTGLYIQLVTKPYTYGSSCSRLHVQLHSVILSTFLIKFLRQG